MKLVIYVLVVFLSVTSLAQMENWYKVDISTLGYKHNNVNFEKRAKTYPDGSLNTFYKDSTYINFKGGSFELTADLLTEHVYFHLDGSIIPDILYVMITQKKQGKRWVNQPYGDYDPGAFLPIRLGFGDNITKYFNLYGGAQWQYSRYFYTPNNTVNYEASLIGGNQYGFGIHGTFAIGPVMVRHSYMYDWISRASTFKGRAQTHETMLVFGFPNVGVFLKSNYQVRQMFSGTYTTNTDAVFQSSTEGETRYYQSQYMNHFSFSVGIYASGLFSGTTRGISKGVSEVEQGLRKERNEKKRRTIEWKEN